MHQAPQAPTGVDPAQRVALIAQLAQLHESGALTDEEFAAQKAALLG